MWECYNCSFQNVDAAPVCVKCRARKPLPGETPQRRSYHASEQASQERLADEVMEKIIPSPPSYKQIFEKWGEAGVSAAAMREELAALDYRVYATRDALKMLINVIKNPQVRGRDELIQNAVMKLINWDPEK
jgi:hypothetical protein